MRKVVFLISLLAVYAGAALPRAQSQAARVTADDYARAEKMLAGYVTPLVYRSGVRANWLPDERFWYRVVTENGSEAVLVDPAKGTKAPCALADCRADAGAAGRGGQAGAGGRGAARTDVPSPDGAHTAYLKDWNLWVRDLQSGKETPLTTDGARDFGYATDNAGWAKSDRAIVLWSPDSKKIATFQQDQRTVGNMYLVKSQVGHPELEAWKYPLPGDEHVALLHRVIIDVEAPKVIPLQMLPRGGMVGRVLEPGCVASGVRLDVARPPCGKALRGGCLDGRGPRGAERRGPDVL